MAKCEDYPCCGHTEQDPCEQQWYDRPGAFDTSIPGNEHALCDHENGECDVEPDDDEPDDDEPDDDEPDDDEPEDSGHYIDAYDTGDSLEYINDDAARLAVLRWNEY